MIRLLGLLFGLAWVVIGWRNLPPMDNRSAATAGLAIGVTCWLSWLAGKATTAARATAIASARAEARARAQAAAAATAQVMVVNAPGGGSAGGPVVPAAWVGGLEAAPWIVGPSNAGLLEEVQDVDQMLEDVGHEVRDERRNVV